MSTGPLPNTLRTLRKAIPYPNSSARAVLSPVDADVRFQGRPVMGTRRPRDHRRSRLSGDGNSHGCRLLATKAIGRPPANVSGRLGQLSGGVNDRFRHIAELAGVAPSSSNRSIPGGPRRRFSIGDPANTLWAVFLCGIDNPSQGGRILEVRDEILLETTYSLRRVEPGNRRNPVAPGRHRSRRQRS